MTQRVRNLSTAYNDQPFSGSGVSLYAGASVAYRKLRVLPGGARRRRRCGWAKGTTGNHDAAAASVLKTARVASAADPTAEITYTVPAADYPGQVTFDVRRYKAHVENTGGGRRVTANLDSGGDGGDAILGTATLLSQEQRDGGIVRLRIAYAPSSDGVQPTVFRATRTAGPTSPADATTTVAEGTRLVEIDTPALSDASAYTYSVVAEDEAGAVTATLLTGISVTADATGPTAPTVGSAEAV